MEILISLIQFISLTVSLIMSASIYVKARGTHGVDGNLMIVFGFSWAVFIYLTFLM